MLRAVSYTHLQLQLAGKQIQIDSTTLNYSAADGQVVQSALVYNLSLIHISMVRRVMDVRNRIVANEYGIQLRNSPQYTAERLKDIHPDTLNAVSYTHLMVAFPQSLQRKHWQALTGV